MPQTKKSRRLIKIAVVYETLSRRLIQIPGARRDRHYVDSKVRVIVA